jgi:hypothetical protein
MEAGTLGDKANPWSVAAFRTLKTVRRSPPSRLRSRSGSTSVPDREQGRRPIHGGEGDQCRAGSCCCSAAIIFVFMLFFADSAERAVVRPR